ncbi:hypothetical protein GJ744_007207 [Endocarpon pusillum]|uniref:Uncharacterized protein n=1 Tax=Endocarpon pusillum TaxID=364733 RepID=A0A8H7A7K8_9EURO|nr:hypothetical protein GJ744_007207 [Endocarpon pusillum]
MHAKILTSLKSSSSSSSSNQTAHEKIWNLPNSLTFSRLLAAPAVGYFILTSQPLAACGLFVYAGLTDLVDGYLARRYQAQTVVGSVIDPMADKALVTIAAVSLAVQGGLPVGLVGLMLARDAGLALAAVYIRWISLPPPKTMRRYWDFSLPSAEVRPSDISKLNTLLQLVLVGTAMLMPLLPPALLRAAHLVAVFDAFQYLVAVTTVWSGASYVFSKDAFTILTRDEIDTRLAEKGKKGKGPGQGGPAAGLDPNEHKTR